MPVLNSGGMSLEAGMATQAISAIGHLWSIGIDGMSRGCAVVYHRNLAKLLVMLQKKYGRRSNA
jgi:hypothetical protein